MTNLSYKFQISSLKYVLGGAFWKKWVPRPNNFFLKSIGNHFKTTFYYFFKVKKPSHLFPAEKGRIFVFVRISSRVEIIVGIIITFILPIHSKPSTFWSFGLWSSTIMILKILKIVPISMQFESMLFVFLFNSILIRIENRINQSKLSFYQ